MHRLAIASCSFTLTSVLWLSAGCGKSDSAADVDASDAGQSEPDTAAPDNDTSSLGPTTGAGIIALASVPDVVTDIFISFDSHPKPNSVVIPLGTCRLELTDADAGASSSDGFGDRTSAGTVAVKAGSQSVAVNYIFPNTGYVPRPLGPLQLGVPFEVHATGAAVPAFDVSLLPTEAITLTSSFDTGVSADAALEIAWQPMSDHPNLSGLSLRVVSEGGYLTCAADPRTGHLVVPPDQFHALASHPLASATCPACVTLEIMPGNQVHVRAGDYDVLVIQTTTTTTSIAVH